MTKRKKTDESPEDVLTERIQKVLGEFGFEYRHLPEVEYCEVVAGVLDAEKCGIEMRLQELRQEEEDGDVDE